MKPKILLCCICTLFYFSCKKEKKTVPAEKMYPLTFTVSGFSQSIVPIGKTKTTSLTTQSTDSIPVQTLMYALYRITGIDTTLVDAGRQNKGDANFGRFTDSVPAGKYYTAICGGTAGLLAYLSPTNNVYGNFFSYSTDYVNGEQGSISQQCNWGDTFFKHMTVTVGTAPVDQDVVLPRRTGRLVVLITDPIPANVKKIKVSFFDMSKLAILNATAKNTTYNTENSSVFTVAATDIGKTNTSIILNTLHNNDKFSVTISAYGTDSTSPLISKVAKDVVCITNTKTTLTGKLFDVSSGGGFTISVNNDWDAPVNIGY